MQIKPEQVPEAVKSVLKSLLRHGELDPAMLAVAVIRAWPGIYKTDGILFSQSLILPMTEKTDAEA
jgi:hypothetical protein